MRVGSRRSSTPTSGRPRPAGRPSSVDELARLSEIRSRGDITDEEFRRAKDLVLTGHGPAEPSGSTSRTSPR